MRVEGQPERVVRAAPRRGEVTAHTAAHSLASRPPWHRLRGPRTLTRRSRAPQERTAATPPVGNPSTGLSVVVGETLRLCALPRKPQLPSTLRR